MKIYDSKPLIKNLTFPESPRWKNNKMWFADIYSDRLYSIFPNGEINTEYNLPTLGFGWLPNGALVYVERNLKYNRIMKYFNGKIEVYCDLSDLSSFQFNDMTVDSYGNIYTGNTGNKMDDINKIDKKTTAPLVLIPCNKKPQIVAENLNFPNGIAISDNNKKLVVAETFNGKITEFEINPDGLLSNRKTFAKLDNCYNTPDGLFFDMEEALWVSTGTNYCIRIKEGGEITHKISTIGDRCNACTMDNKGTIYLCTRGKKNPDTINLSHRSGMIEIVNDNFIPRAGYP
jgi:sugar lactone lactonase YvrE